MGVVMMTIVLGLVLRRHIGTQNETPVTLVSWYWHFVDVVWVVVFSVVYLFGR
jgi:heme/copper-type cytochrome/quinol oxidase subunit 3